MESEQNKKSKIAEREEGILKFWEEHQIFKKSLEKKSPKGDFVFYDGPPFATGLPHYGHILAGTIKDVIPRFKTMRGFRVPRRWGWDCHGLPVENEVEKELGFTTKKDIEHYGIAKFNEAAKKIVMRYTNDWRDQIPRFGRWVDMENDYRTMDSSYTESVWWVFKTLYEKGLIYEGFKSMHLCPRCETTLSNFEVTQNYKELTDTSVYVKFQLLSQANTFLLAWTTTPWTLPGNAALAVHPELDYAFVEITASNAPEIPAGDTFIVGAKEEILKRVFSAPSALGGSGGGKAFQFDPLSRVGSFSWKGAQVAFSAKKGMKGKDLIGQFYEPVFDYYSKNASLPNCEQGWRIYGGDFVTEEDGTGIVHIAPAFGEDDYELAGREKLPFIQHVSTDGSFKKEVIDLAGLQAKPTGNPREADEKIATLLAARGSLLKKEDVRHDYPHCWRCETPLLNYAAPSWFVKVSELRGKLAEENSKINWVPKDVGEYRFGNWLAEARDWAISRSRFWGAPIPVWRCERCGALKAIGSMDEVRVGSKEIITKFVLLRHGESEKNTGHVFDDSPEGFGLIRAGREEAKAAAKRIEAMGLFRPFRSDGKTSSQDTAVSGGVDAVYASPVRRARETAGIVAAHLEKPVTVDERLREVDSGEWDGRREDDPAIGASRAVYNALPAEAYFTARRGGSGESWQDVELRMGHAVEDILAKHAGETILLVSHEGPLVYLLKTLRNLTLNETDKFFRTDLFKGYAQPITVYVHTKTRKEFDPHRPFIDDVLLHCDTCARSTGTGDNLMRRVPEVFDCWFESGAMPYGQAHYPFEHDGAFDPSEGWFRKSKGFPADFIAEGLDQTRGWFYSLLVLATGLFGKSPYKNVVVNGIILAENGEKMAKRLRNYPDPLEVVAKYGADALRYYLLSSPVVRGEELRFSERGVDEVAKKVFNRLDNVLAFYLLYADKTDLRFKIRDLSNVLDGWIISRLNQLATGVTGALEAYELDKATRSIGEFVDDLSTWYLRRSRERIKSFVAEEKEAALGTFRFVLCELSKIMAPFTPFFAEYLFQELGTNSRMNPNDANKIRSVHLEDWPQGGKIDLELLKKMKEVRNICSSALQGRAQHKINVRQPLSLLKIWSPILTTRDHDLLELIKAEANVKNIEVSNEIKPEGMKIELDTALTPELKDEGQFRELARFVQDMRKKQGFRAVEFATLSVAAAGASRRFIEQHEHELSRIAALKNVVIAETLSGGEQFQADEIALTLQLSR